jgi:hypothetical protein
MYAERKADFMMNETTAQFFKASSISTREIQFYRGLKMVYGIHNYSYFGLLPSTVTGTSSLL